MEFLTVPGETVSLANLFRLLAKRWAILMVGLVVTAGAAFVAAQEHPVQFSRTDVVFMAPSSSLYPNSLQTRSEDLIVTAGVVAKRVMGPAEPLKFASPETILASIPSIGTDYWVRLPDSGGQWAPHFANQVLFVDIVGDSADEVRQTQAEVIQRIRDELDLLQREQNVAPVNDITITVAPEVAVVQEISGSRVRAVAMTLTLGAGATIAVIVALEVAAARRHRRDVESAQQRMRAPARV